MCIEFWLSFSHLFSSLHSEASWQTVVLNLKSSKKGFGELTMFELLIVVGLGSAIGDPMIYQEAMSIPQALTAIVIVVILFKLIYSS